MNQRNYHYMIDHELSNEKRLYYRSANSGLYCFEYDSKKERYCFYKCDFEGNILCDVVGLAFSASEIFEAPRGDSAIEFSVKTMIKLNIVGSEKNDQTKY